eukprot:752204-Hanusia_phi.AAC.2
MLVHAFQAREEQVYQQDFDQILLLLPADPCSTNDELLYLPQIHSRSEVPHKLEIISAPRPFRRSQRVHQDVGMESQDSGAPVRSELSRLRALRNRQIGREMAMVMDTRRAIELRVVSLQQQIL